MSFVILLVSKALNLMWRSYRHVKNMIATLNDKFLESKDQFTYLGSNISSTESDVNICIEKAWTAVDKLTTTRKSSLFD